MINDKCLMINDKDIQNEERFLSFDLDREITGLLKLGDLRGVINFELKDVVPVPELDRFTLGIINDRGVATWIVDLVGLLGGTHWCKKSYVPNSGMAMLIEVNNQKIGLSIQRVKTIKIYNPNSCFSIPYGMFPEELKDFFTGYFLDKDEKISVLLKLERIVETIKN